MKVLVIDDNVEDFDLLKEFLGEVRDDLEFAWAPSGEKGLEMAREFHPDVIYLDTVMPGKDGLEICRELKESGDKTARVIVMTGSLDAVGEARARHAGADDYCVKVEESLRETLLP